MKNLSIPVVLVMVLLASACVGDNETQDPTAQPSTLSHGDVSATSLESTGLDNAINTRWSDTKRSTVRCAQDSEPVLTSIKAFILGTTAVDVELYGHTCGKELGSFRFAVLDDEERDISGRSWPEVEAIEIEEDGSFMIRAVAAGCSNYESGRRIAVHLSSEEDNTNVLEIDIEKPLYLEHGETCGAIGTACGTDARCGSAGVCEAY